NGASPATGVMGQPDLTTGALAASTAMMNLKNPMGLTVDSKGTLYVTDTGNNRVVAYVTKTISATGTVPSQLWGQIDFISNSPNRGGTDPTLTSLSGPTAVAITSKGTMFVSDTGNERVMRDMASLSMVQPNTGNLTGSGFLPSAPAPPP